LTAPDTALAGSDRVPGAVFAVLVVACFGAFFLTQRLKHTPTVVQRFELSPSFSPGAREPGGLEEISFKLSHADDVTVTIVDSSGADVATLVHNHPVVRYKQFSLRWAGHLGSPRGYAFVKTPGGRSVLLPENRGRLAASGDYRVRVRLRGERREVLSPRSFTLVRP
jgi:hypothetical protein